MTSLESSILKVLVYFDIFHYPISIDEIRDYLDQQVKQQEISETVERLMEYGFIYKFDDFYTLQDNLTLVHRRLNGNKKAEHLLPKAQKIAKRLYRFPFVRGIGISGSLSKNFADENSDFDYFIITKANRLWIARSLMGLLKKASFFTRNRHWFCLNYYIDESSLKISENNIFTATELLTLLASNGKDTLNQFFKENSWVNNYYPVYNKSRFISETTESNSFIKRSLELLLNNSFGNKVDNWLMKRSIKRWEKKKLTGSLTDLKGKEIELPLTSKNYCKQDPKYFQEKVLNTFKERLKAIEIKLYELQVTSSCGEK